VLQLSDFCRLACALCRRRAQLHSIGIAAIWSGDQWPCPASGPPLVVNLRYAATRAVSSTRALPSRLRQHHNQKRNGKLHQQGQGSFNLEQLMAADSYSLGLILWEVAYPALLRPGLDYLSTANPLSASLTLPVQNHPALPFIAETLAECWTPASVGKRLSPASLHARFSSLAPNFCLKFLFNLPAN
uniref:Receptor protein serine/threonine kinase n=1 Tax=Macrostomum lignano TaxID=282301 RepID=A0A1I8FCK7_9PLAT